MELIYNVLMDALKKIQLLEPEYNIEIKSEPEYYIHLVNLSLNQSIIVRFSKFFFLLKACKNRQSLKTIGDCPGSPVCSGRPVV